ncbi:MAG: TetR/AcrR family transcriptional regulator [Chloroflexota bacterium]
MPMSDRNPQKRRQAQTRQDIIQNAHRMIVDQGIGGLSIRAVADSINYTPGALYKYFESKDDLIDAVRADCFERLNIFILERVQSATNAADMLLQGGMAYIEYAGQYPQEYHLMFNMEPSWAHPASNRAIAMRSLLTIIQLGIDQGQFVTGVMTPIPLPIIAGRPCMGSHHYRRMSCKMSATTCFS